MNIGQLDAAIRAGAADTIVLLAWLLFGARRRVGLPAALFAPLALCLAGFVIGNTPITMLAPAGIVGTIAHTASGFTVVFLWWFCLSCFDSQFRLKGGVLGVGLAWAAIAALDRGLLGDALARKGLSLLLVPLGFAIIGRLVWRLLFERQGDLIQQRHDARIMVAVLLGGMLFIDLTADALFGFPWRPLAFAMAQNAMALAFGLWLAGRLLSFASGSCRIDDEELAKDRAARALRFGFSPPADRLPDALRGRDVLELVGGGIDDVRFRLGKLHEALGLAPLLDRWVGDCSAGMRQRIAIAAAFAGGQPLVILDEPFNWLDPVAIFDLREVLRDMVDDGLTLITALHDLGTLASACDAGLMLADGKVALALGDDALRIAAQNPQAFERHTINHLRSGSVARC